jgi:glycosyltransferase involved in cell wall biosynthesis
MASMLGERQTMAHTDVGAGLQGIEATGITLLKKAPNAMTTAHPFIPLSNDPPFRVLCIAGWWPDDEGLSGIFIKEHVLAIASRCAVEVAFLEVCKSPWTWPTFSHATSMESDIPVHRVLVKTPLRRCGSQELLVRRAFTRLFRALRTKHRFDLVHIHVRTEVTEQVISIAEKMGLPVVVTEHNSFYHLGIRSLPQNEENRIRQHIRKWFTSANIAAVMPVSEDLANVLSNEFNVEPGLITVVPNVAHAAFKPGPRSQQPPFRMVLAAVWRPPKDHAVFIEALAALPRELRTACRVDWVGYGPDMEVIKARCHIELPDVDIHFPGKLDKPALAELMQKAHLFVLPTKADNLPCVVLESHCCGTPVVSMAVNGLPEMVDGTNGMLVPPNAPLAMAEALAHCIRTPNQFDHHVIAEKARSRYSSEAVANAIIGIYGKVMTTWSKDRSSASRTTAFQADDNAQRNLDSR